MIKKKHALILAIIGTVLTALFFAFFQKPEDPRGKGGNYPLPGTVSSPTPTSQNKLNYEQELLNSDRIQMNEVSYSELSKNEALFVVTSAPLQHKLWEIDS